MSDGVYDMPEEPRRSRRTPGQRPRALLPTIATLIVLLILFSVFTDVWTQRLWYRSVDLGSVFSTVLGTRVLLFVIVGLLMAVAVVANVIVAFRTRPRVALAPSPSPGFERYGELLQQRGKIAVGVLATLMLVFGGSAASGEWKVFLAWKNRTSFGVTDKHFNKDISFFVFDYPWLRVLLGFGYSIVLLSLVAAIITHYLYGGFRPSAKGQKASGAAQVQFSVLLGLLVLLKAFSYWLDRFGQTTADSRLFTGISYTGDHAVLPSKEILAVIAVLCAGLFFANVVRKTWLLPGVGTVVLILSAILLGALWPASLQQLRVRPSEPVKEAPYITKNIEATRQAYGLENTKVINYEAKTTAQADQLAADAEVLPGIRLIDPTVVGPTFEQLQQVRGFYSFPTDLDVDRYKIGNQVRDTVIAVREVQVDRLPAGQRNWNNDHTVYTHGFGVVAANGNQRASDGTPVWSSKDLPPTGQLGDYEPRIYFGEQSPDYSIVGGSKNGQPVELDTPEGKNGGDPTLNTYSGKGGVPVGSFGNRLLYATKFRDANILLSSRVTPESKILYDRTPRERVEKAAPWLTPDGDPYPAVVDGQVVWIVDGYTTSANYPYSEKVALDDSTRDTTTGRGTIAQQPSEQINYIRNSVKAVVNAYDGSVELYAWDESDPVLKTWMKAFPGTVKPRSEISPSLKSHLRYPEDMFKVQRDLLAKYHVTDSTTWYQNSDLWRVPVDPTQGAASADSSPVSQPPFYLSLRMPGQTDPKFSLTSVYVPNAERENLTAFMAVDSEASSPDYGQFRILRLPGNVQIPGPGQVANKFQTDDAIRAALLPINQPSSGARAQYGNLLTLPLGGGLLYVQPVYSVRTSGAGSYPVLRYVLVSFGDRVAFGATLQEALTKVFNTEVNTGEPDPNGTKPDNPPANPTVKQALAEAQAAWDNAQAALKRGDLAGYQSQVNKMKAAIDRANAAVTPTPTPTGTPSGTPTTPATPPTSPPTSPTS
ncbi:hypothetical protein EV138_5309 [Kribbella voronezhensis]|uniref:UPF0182 protein EV138_5309 n=1 Tax=Kribbella voronezhensis TaxID=2512212 RepID=A0A4R7TJ88_9ACTN|nr:UPF0182 family protein [Kribbella voronezhensis]TDU91698.1 hypothetical protein EV138_5309 [Kribbella voronezhensis]